MEAQMQTWEITFRPSGETDSAFTSSSSWNVRRIERASQKNETRRRQVHGETA